MIFCVVPEPLADELFDKLTTHYADDENVTVIVDRRQYERSNASVGSGQRQTPERRRVRVAGDLPNLAG